MSAGEQLTPEIQPLKILTDEHNAVAWFRLDPENPENLGQQRLQLASLQGLSPDHPDIIEATDQLQEGNTLFARTWVRTILSHAQSDYELAVDGMTGLKTKREYDRWLTSTYDVDRRAPKARTFTCIWGDVNNFKRINDVLGDPVGDEVMEAVGKEVTENLRVGDHIIGVRPHTAGDEVIIAATDLTEEESKGLWRRLYTDQWQKVGLQGQIWQSITATLQQRPAEETDIHVRTEVTSVQGEDIVLSRRVLVINDQVICNLRDLAVIDFGYSTGLPETLEDVSAISAQALRQKDEIKAATRTRIQAYRSSGNS